MKHLPTIAILCAAGAAHAGIQGSQINEAVRRLPSGAIVAEEPPGPANGRQIVTKPSFWAPGVYLPSFVMASKDGSLKECAWPWLDAGCRPYVPKQDRRERAWVIKSAGQWLKCPHNNTLAGCVGYDALPNMAVQD